MNTIYAIPIAVLTVMLILEIVHLVVFGRYAPKEIIEKLLTQKWEDYMNAGMNLACDMFYGPADLPAIWKFPPSITSAWYISNVGRIPRWSKFHKKLNEAKTIVKEGHRREFLKKIGL